MSKYNHMLDIAFIVISETEDPNDIAPEEIHLAIERRLVTLREEGEYDIGGNIGHCDTYICDEEETSIEEDVLAINKLANEIKGKPHE